MTRRPPRPMTRLDPARTMRLPSFGRRTRQAWAATSADGRWSYRRLEVPGTPWVVLHGDGEEWGTGFGTLSRARAATAAHDTNTKEAIA